MKPLEHAAGPEAAAVIDLTALKSRQQAAWSSGDYAVVGTTLQIVGETLCEAVDLRAGQRVLDVAAGNGNASLAAARRWCHVTSTDYVPALLERAKERASAERLTIAFQEADAENLPFGDESFDVALSTFGVMFVADHERAAAELVRVCKRGGRIGMASWTPDGFIGQLFKTLGRHAPPPAGAKSPARWGSHEGLAELFEPHGCEIVSTERRFAFRYRCARHWLMVFMTFYGPILKVFAALPPERQLALEHDLLALVETFNVARDGGVVVPSAYLETVITRR